MGTGKDRHDGTEQVAMPTEDGVSSRYIEAAQRDATAAFMAGKPARKSRSPMGKEIDDLRAEVNLLRDEVAAAHVEITQCREGLDSRMSAWVGKVRGEIETAQRYEADTNGKLQRFVAKWEERWPEIVTGARLNAAIEQSQVAAKSSRRDMQDLVDGVELRLHQRHRELEAQLRNLVGHTVGTQIANEAVQRTTGERVLRHSIEAQGTQLRRLESIVDDLVANTFRPTLLRRLRNWVAARRRGEGS